MSVNGDPAKEAQITRVLQNLLATQYALDKDDLERVNRLIQYSSNKTGLTEEERKILTARGLMDATDETLAVPSEFIFRSTITPTFWLKCLMALDGLIDFSGKNETPSK